MCLTGIEKRFILQKMEAFIGHGSSAQSSEVREPYGWSLSFTIRDCDPSRIRDTQVIKDFTPALCQVIDMKTYGEPIIRRFIHPDQRFRVIQLIQMIETSNVSGLFVVRTRSAYLDIFSCKPYDPDAAADFSQDYFKGMAADTRFSRRG